MRRVTLVLLAGLQICRARQPSFSIHDDLLAYPQFEVVFSDSYISESDALALLEDSSSPHPAYEADFSSQTDLTSEVRESSVADPPRGAHSSHADDGTAQVSETYELMNVLPARYLCAVPVLAPPPAPNHTATELAKAEEARELSRASIKGWELMSDLEGQCLYFMFGWWSYSFCYGKEIVQFHAMPSGHKNTPPVKDPQSQEYVLGRVHYDTHNAPNRQSNQRPPGGTDGYQEAGQTVATPATTGAEGSSAMQSPPNTELQVKDNQRYLVQRLDGGTICDLTGRERTIEVQYHCHPGLAGDRIGWIKEVTTCTYLMVVQTPRLCADVAFLPPKEGHAHPISCRTIVGSAEDEEKWRAAKSIEAREGMLGEAATKGRSNKDQNHNHQHSGAVNIGGVLVGGQRMLGSGTDGQPAARLLPTRHFSSGNGKAGSHGGAMVEILAKGHSKADGGKVEILSKEELEKLDLSPEAIEELRRELQKLAGDNGWKLEIVEAPGEVPEIIGVVESDDDQEGEAADEGQDGGAATQAKTPKKVVKGKGSSSNRDRAKEGAKDVTRERNDDDGDDDEGSEENFFHEDL